MSTRIIFLLTFNLCYCFRILNFFLEFPKHPSLDCALNLYWSMRCTSSWKYGLHFWGLGPSPHKIPQAPPETTHKWKTESSQFSGVAQKPKKTILIQQKKYMIFLNGCFIFFSSLAFLNLIMFQRKLFCLTFKENLSIFFLFTGNLFSQSLEQNSVLFPFSHIWHSLYFYLTSIYISLIYHSHAVTKS